MKPVRPPTTRERARPIRTANPRMQDLTNGELSFEDSDSDIQQVYPPVPIQPSTRQHRRPVQRTVPFSANNYNSNVDLNHQPGVDEVAVERDNQRSSPSAPPHRLIRDREHRVLPQNQNNIPRRQHNESGRQTAFDAS